jgi:hypothetical protein
MEGLLAMGREDHAGGRDRILLRGLGRRGKNTAPGFSPWGLNPGDQDNITSFG